MLDLRGSEVSHPLAQAVVSVIGAQFANERRGMEDDRRIRHSDEASASRRLKASMKLCVSDSRYVDGGFFHSAA